MQQSKVIVGRLQQIKCPRNEKPKIRKVILWSVQFGAARVLWGPKEERGGGEWLHESKYVVWAAVAEGGGGVNVWSIVDVVASWVKWMSQEMENANKYGKQVTGYIEENTKHPAEVTWAGRRWMKRTRSERKVENTNILK